MRFRMKCRWELHWELISPMDEIHHIFYCALFYDLSHFPMALGL